MISLKGAVTVGLVIAAPPNVHPPWRPGSGAYGCPVPTSSSIAGAQALEGALFLPALQHFPLKHISFDSDPNEGHGTLTRHRSADTRVDRLWHELYLLVLIAEPRSAETNHDCAERHGRRAGVRRHCKTLRPFANDLLLLEPGLDSRCIAALVANREDELGVDPFSNDVEVPLNPRRPCSGVRECHSIGRHCAHWRCGLMASAKRVRRH